MIFPFAIPTALPAILVNSAIEMIERGLLPRSLTRIAIRRLLKQRLASLQNNHPNELTQKMHEACITDDVAPVPEKANEQHYELPAEFFLQILGPRLKYSSCYFEDGDSLADAEVKSLERTCENAELEDGMDILELGCGWGSLTLTMAAKFPNSRITAVSNSHSQREFIQNRAEQEGLADRVEIITADMNDFDTSSRFDRIVSVEMFEHMRNYEELLKRVQSWLNPEGKLFIHIFCHRDYCYPFETDGASNWMGRYFFTGGIMPSISLMQSFDKHMKLAKSKTWDGTHYQKTCLAWADEMQKRRRQVLPILRQAYGDEAHRWWHRWLLFFEAGAELFGFEKGQQWQVVHLLFEQQPVHDKQPELVPAGN